jgi:hypothetical protein
VGQGAGGVSIDPTIAQFCASSFSLKAPQMNQEFDHAANDSPRSGSSKQVMPMLWCAIIAAIIAIAVWYLIKV